MTSDLKTTTTRILKLASDDNRVCERAKDMLMFYAEGLETDGRRDIDDVAWDFAEAPPMNWQILEQWDGEDPEIGLAHFESIWDAMSARIVERNLEKLTNESVQLYWDQLGQAINKISQALAALIS